MHTELPYTCIFLQKSTKSFKSVNFRFITVVRWHEGVINSLFLFNNRDTWNITLVGKVIANHFLKKVILQIKSKVISQSLPSITLTVHFMLYHHQIWTFDSRYYQILLIIKAICPAICTSISRRHSFPSD